MSKGRFRAAWLASAFFLSATCNLATAGPIADCNQNGVPDANDLLSPDFGDCNNNSVLDVCDVDPADPDGNTLVSVDRNGNRRPDECDLGGRLVGPGVHINPRTGHATKLPPPPGVAPADDPNWIAFAPDGTLYGLRDYELYTIDRDSWMTTGVATLDRRVVSPTFAPDGSLYALARGGGHNLTELATVDLDTGGVTVLGSFKLVDLFNYPAAIAFAPDGNLYSVHEDPYLDTIFLAEIHLATLGVVPVEQLPLGQWGGYPESLTFSPDGVRHSSSTNYYSELGSNSYAEIDGLPAPFSYGPRSIATASDEIFYAATTGGLFDLRKGVYLNSGFNSDDYAADGSSLYSAGTELNQIDFDTGVVRPLGGFHRSYVNPRVHELTFCPHGNFAIICEGICIELATFEGTELMRTDPIYVNGQVGALVCQDGNLYGINQSSSQVVVMSYLGPIGVEGIPVSTLTATVTDLAAGPNRTIYGIDHEQLVTVNLQTGIVVPIGPLGTQVSTIAYVAATVDSRDAAFCVQGPANLTFGDCNDYDFTGDGTVDLRDLSGLWLIDQR